MSIFLHLPVIISVLILLAVTISVSALGLKLVRRRYTNDTLKENHEVAGYIFNAFGLIYAVLLAFVVFVSWTDYSDSKKNVEREANLLVDIFSNSRGFPDTMQANIRLTLNEYAKLIIEDEWKTMEHGRFSPAARDQIAKLWNIYIMADVKALPNQIAYEESVKRLNDLSECRRTRIFNSRDTIPGIIWFVLLVCASCSVGYTFFFGVRNIKAQYVMTFTLAMINTLILYLIFVLDHPFTGSSKISSTMFEAVLRLFQQTM